MTDDLTRPGDLQLAQASSQAIPNQDVVVVTQPPNGEDVFLPSPANRVYDLRFDPRLAKVRVIDADGDGDLDLVLRFNAGTPEESQIVFIDMVKSAQSGLAPIMRVGEEQFGADIVVQKALALAGEQPTLETAAPSGPEAVGTGATRYDDDMGNLIDLLDAQDVILGVELAFPSIEPDETEEEVDSAENLDLLPPIAVDFAVISGEGELVGIPGSDLTVGGFVFRFDVGEGNDISDNIRGTDAEDGVTTDFTITSPPDVGVLVIDRDSDGILDEVYGVSNAFIPAAQPLPPDGIDIDSNDTVFSFLPIEEVNAAPLNGVVPDSSGFTYFTTDSDGLISDPATIEIGFEASVTAIGSNANDEDDQPEPHTVPNPNGADSGPILGGAGADILIGDPGGAELSGQFNIALAVDVTGSIGPDNIATLNAAVEDLVQQIIDRGIADRTVIHLITFAVRSDQTTSGLEFSKTFTWDGSQFVTADDQTFADAIEVEVADPIGSTDFEPPLQDAANFFNGLNGDTGPNDDDVNRIFFLTDGQDNSGPGGSFNPDAVPDLYGPTGLIVQEDLQIRVFGIESFGGIDSGFDPDQLNLLDDGLPPQPGEALHEGQGPLVDQVEADIAVIGFDDLDTALTDELLASLLEEVGGDVMSGGDGNDIIFGDVANTGALALAEGIDLPPGSGWLVFEALEAGQSTSSPGWDRGDTIAYLGDSANWSNLIGAGRGEGDTIDAGAGDDVIFGQGGGDSLIGGPGADTFVYTLAADEGDDEILDFSTNEGDLLAFVNVLDADSSGTLGIEDVVDSFVDGGGAGAVDTLVLESGTTIMVTDVNGTLTDLASLEANVLINGAIA